MKACKSNRKIVEIDKDVDLKANAISSLRKRKCRSF